MPSCWHSRPVERARPLLGTIVAVRVHDLPEPCAHRAIEAAFAEIAATHRAMSFHEPDSDVSRLNREAWRRPVRVSPHTAVVLRLAQFFAAATDGVFDITTAAELVAAGGLPRPDSPLPDPCASWRDIELGPERTVHFRRKLWIDLGGVAKGYAVDRAVTCLIRHGVRQCCVNAGGDLRILGPAPERVMLRVGDLPGAMAAVLELADCSLASSGERQGLAVGAGQTGQHFDGVSRRSVGCGAVACVVAESCAVADALTKPVLAIGEKWAAALRRLGATAYRLDAAGHWRHFGAAA